jgi:NADPH:quinone reductase-like Zn-dependent oxidoreductase
MKAIQATERGGYEALRLVDIPQPQPQAGQALVRVTSAGVTPLDRTVLAGLHPGRHFRRDGIGAEREPRAVARRDPR